MTTRHLGLLHPYTGEGVELFNPDLHETAAWKAVRCGKCQREYVCTPWDDYNTPADHLHWTGDPVCDPCLLRIAWERGSASS